MNLMCGNFSSLVLDNPAAYGSFRVKGSPLVPLPVTDTPRTSARNAKIADFLYRSLGSISFRVIDLRLSFEKANSKSLFVRVRLFPVSAEMTRIEFGSLTSSILMTLSLARVLMLELCSA